MIYPLKHQLLEIEKKKIKIKTLDIRYLWVLDYLTICQTGSFINPSLIDLNKKNVF